MSVGVSAISTSSSFPMTAHRASVSFATAGNGGDGGGWGFVPNGYVSWALSKDGTWGWGLALPFGLKVEYDKSWIGAAQSTSFDIKTYNLNPSIAYRVNDTVSVGFGLNWQRIEAEYLRQAGTTAKYLASASQNEAMTIPGAGTPGCCSSFLRRPRSGFRYRSR